MPQISKIERQEIALHLETKHSHKEIAFMLGRDKSTISREIRRNSVNGIYAPQKAQLKKYVRRKYCKFRQKKIRANSELEDYTREKLKEGWSPEKIAGRWSLEHPGLKITFVTIYKYLYSEFGSSLCKYLLSRRDHRKRRRSRKTERQLIPNRVWIDERPRVANSRSEIGHFEGDLIVSLRGDRSVLLTLADRSSRYLVARKMPNKKAQPMAEAMRNISEDLNFKTLTLDNGIEFQKHEQIGCDTYFCHPYSSWEKGTIENTNGLIRRYIPKKSRIKDVSVKKLNQIITKLNNTPRKCLNFLTPKEVHFALWNQST